MDQNQAIDIAKNYADIVINHFQVKKIILFGSYAKGITNSESDIDIAVIVNRLEDDFLDSEAKLYKLRRQNDVRIEPLLLDELNDSNGFLQQIINEGEVIFSVD